MTYLSAVGPLARSAGDLRTGLKVTAGPEAPSSLAYTWRLSPPRHTQLGRFRVGVVFDHPHAPVSSEVTTLLADAVDTLTRAGATVIEGWPAGIDPVRDYEAFEFHLQLFFAFQEPDASFVRLPQFMGRTRRMATRAAWSRYFEAIDVFLCPTNFTPAFAHDNRPFAQRTIATPEGQRPYDAQAFWVSHAALAGLPAVSAPIGRTPGSLPVGAQIIGPLYDDDTALTFAELLAEVVGGVRASTDLTDLTMRSGALSADLLGAVQLSVRLNDHDSLFPS